MSKTKSMYGLHNRKFGALDRLLEKSDCQETGRKAYSAAKKKNRRYAKQ